jgi:hypothetical protein
MQGVSRSASKCDGEAVEILRKDALGESTDASDNHDNFHSTE